MMYYDYPEKDLIHSWKKNLTSYELRDDSAYNGALNPVIFETAEEALEKALLLSKQKKEAFMVAQWFDDFDRH